VRESEGGGGTVRGWCIPIAGGGERLVAGY